MILFASFFLEIYENFWSAVFSAAMVLFLFCPFGGEWDGREAHSCTSLVYTVPGELSRGNMEEKGFGKFVLGSEDRK